MTTTIHKKLLVLLLCCWAVQSACGQTWDFLKAKSAELDTVRTAQILEQCRKNGLTPADAARLFTPARTAQAESLPADSILDKIEEGLAKKVDPLRIVQAAETRLNYLQQANQLMCSVHRGRGGGGDPSHLIERIGTILESGLPEETLQKIFSRRSGGFRYGRILHVIDAGETLQLAGCSPELTQQFMADCIDRNLSHPDVARAVDFIVAEHAKGRDFQSIFQGLWVKPE